MPQTYLFYIATRAAGLAALLVAASCQQQAVTPGGSTLTATVSNSADLHLTGSALVLSRMASTDTTVAPASLNLTGLSGNLAISFRVNKFKGVGTYQLKRGVSGGPAETGEASYSEGGVNYYTSAVPGPVVGQVVVSTFDAATRHAQGTFSFTVRSGVTGQTKQVTNGAFDIYEVIL